MKTSINILNLSLFHLVSLLSCLALPKDVEEDTKNLDAGQWLQQNTQIVKNSSVVKPKDKHRFKIPLQLKPAYLKPFTAPSAENCQCGKAPQRTRRHQRFAHGTAATKSIPWLVSIQEFKSHSFCGGTLIDRRHVLTAAHCLSRYITQNGKKNFMKRVTALLSLNELNVDDDNDGQIYKKIDDVIMHPGYKSASDGYDIAILRLNENVPLSGQIYPACLPLGNSNFAGQRAVIAGWGTPIPNFKGPVTLNIGKVIILENSECYEKWYYETYTEHIRGEMICTEGENGIGTATYGDSGGSVIVQEHGLSVVVGIISYIDNENVLPNVHTRVSSFYHWLTQNSLAGSCQ